MNRMLFSSLLLLNLACRTDKDPLVENEPDVEIIDVDGDGFSPEEDCNDGDASIFPTATEICDGIDNDCDDEIDEEVLNTWYADDDADGFGDPDDTTEACEGSDGWVATGNDCDDTDPNSYPGATERCDDNDNDCDGEIDEEVLHIWYADADGDGYGDPDSGYETCDPPEGYVEDDSDCNDLSDAAYPGAEEVCDTLDNDCDEEIDEDVERAWFTDADGDGHGNADSPVNACDPPEGTVASNDDCDDTDSTISPDATEICDGVDNDCNGSIDEDTAIDVSAWYEDDDGDGYGDPGDVSWSCTAPSGSVADDTDCDDGDAAISPAATEICNDIDDDCDGDIDDDDSDVTGTAIWYIDYDGDGFGSEDYVENACEAPSGWVSDATDCDDADVAVNPDATEVCNEVDDDCDGDIDDADTGVTSTSTWYEDDDGDGYGTASSSVTACESPSGHVSDATDCDDADDSINPGAEELCDSIDNDCDGDIDGDDSSMIVDSLSTWYQDDDLDGYGDAGSSIEACEEPSGYVVDDTDCDDDEADVNPGAEEVCDSLDNDCDGDTDEGQYGLGEDCAAIDCQDVLDDDPSAADGPYWIEPDGTAFEAICDMSTDDGGWTLLLSADGSSTYWGNNSEYWWAEGADAVPETLDGSDFHGQAYGDMATEEIRLCYQDVDTCYTFEHGLGISLLAFFDSDITYTEYSSGSYGFSNTGSSASMSDYLSALGVSAHSTNCQWLGINNVNATSAIGLMGDWNGGCDGAGYPYHDDLAIGVGLQSCYDSNDCYSGGSGHYAGQSRGWNGTDDSGIQGPWYVWGR